MPQFSRSPFPLLVPAAAAVVLAIPGTVHAQEPPALPRSTTSGELALDFRARLQPGKKADGDLFGGYFFVRRDAATPTGGGVSVNLGGLNQYGAFRWQQANVETEISTGGSASLRVLAGILRVPFGVYDYRETYASGLIDYPLARVDYAYNAVDWSVPGVQATVSRGNVQGEIAYFNGPGAGVWGNINGVDGAVVRLQAYAPPHLILGASGWAGHQAALPGARHRERTTLGGLDARYTRSHLLLRGELLAGLQAGETMRGGYVDVYYRLPGVETVTLVARGEAYKPGSDEGQARQYTLGVRWIPAPDWTLSGNWVRSDLPASYGPTWTTPTGASGALRFQAMRRFSLH